MDDRHRTDDDGPQRREVTVPRRLYKTVTVFSTLLAMVSVIVGFVLLDSATQRASLEIQQIDPVLALLGLAFLVAGAAIYAFSTRFRTEGMSNAKDATDEGSNNG